jgi:hypothetical protein
MSQLAPGRLYTGTQPVRDPAYKRFIRALPCVACLKTWNIDSCHTGGHGLGQKSSDRACIPLCRQCHGELDANPAEFVERNKLDIVALIQRFNEFYQTKLGGGKAA